MYFIITSYPGTQINIPDSTVELLNNESPEILDFGTPTPVILVSDTQGPENLDYVQMPDTHLLEPDNTELQQITSSASIKFLIYQFMLLIIYI